MSKLAKTGESTELAQMLQVDVVSTALPEARALLRARTCMRERDLREAFDTTEIDREFVHRRLLEYLPEYEAELPDVVKYLVDEHEQLGSNILVISPDTGRAVARLSDKDFYQPAPVSRETGGMVTLPVRIRPEVESYIVQSRFDGERDTRVYEHMLTRIPKSQLPEMVRRKTSFLTKAGRQEVASTIHDRLPGLIGSATGIARDLFKYFPLDGCTDWCEEFKAEVSVHLRIGVQDAMTQNMGHDVVHASSAVVTAGWARAIGHLVLRGALSKVIPEYASEVEGAGLFIASANTARYLDGHTLIVEGLDGVAVHLVLEPAGKLEARDYTTQWREVHDKWSLEAKLDGVLYVDWSKVQLFRIEGVEPSGISVDVLH